MGIFIKDMFLMGCEMEWANINLMIYINIKEIG